MSQSYIIHKLCNLNVRNRITVINKEPYKENKRLVKSFNFIMDIEKTKNFKRKKSNKFEKKGVRKVSVSFIVSIFVGLHILTLSSLLVTFNPLMDHYKFYTIRPSPDEISIPSSLFMSHRRTPGTVRILRSRCVNCKSHD